MFVGQVKDGEVDFVALKEGNITYYQVSATTLDEHTLKRELAPFEKIKDYYPKYLLTLDELFSTLNYEGIQKRNVIDWLLDNSRNW